MELLKRKRKPLRAAFTRSYNILMNICDAEQVKLEDAQCKFMSLERTHINLGEVDNQILSLLLEADDDTEYASEFEAIEEFSEKFDKAKVRVNALSKNSEEQNSISLIVEKSKLKLPKIELMKFGGEVKDWLSFWSQFKRIHEEKQMELEDKFQYLIQCMAPGSRAKEIMDSYPPTADNYMKAVESLKTRFGREELLIEFYVRELLGLVVKNATNMRKINIMQLYDKLESHLRSLESIGMASDKYAAMLFPLVESCIPEDILRVWLRNPAVGTEERTYSDKLSQLLLFLKAEVEGEERISLAKAGIRQNDTIERKRVKEAANFIPTANDLVAPAREVPKVSCIFCGKSHLSKDCFHAQNLTLEERINIVKNKKCCFSCLKIGHRAKNCRSNAFCILCKKKHYVILCPDLKPNAKMSSPSCKEKEETNTLSNICPMGEVLLQTLLVAIEIEGNQNVVRVLIDTGSQHSYILQSTVNRMGIKPLRNLNLKHVVFGGATSSREHKCYTVKLSNLHTDYSSEILVLDQPAICGSLPRIQRGPWIDELAEKGILLVDVGQQRPPIELLIGADFASRLYTGRIHEVQLGLVAVETYLGWVLMGTPFQGAAEESLAAVTTSLLIHNENIVDLWKLEAIGIIDPCEQISREERENAVRDHFINTVKIDEEGRYEIKLPWKEIKELKDYRSLAEKRLDRVTAKLIAENRYEEYNAVFEDWLREKIIEEVPIDEEWSKPCCYLPHRGVFKSNSTTKVRPVFDASCKQKGNLSLNDSLEKGPNTLELIPKILTRFREKPIGVLADIKKAFLQISVAEEERDFLRFLWWKDFENRELKILRHRRVVFGVNCSPFILGAVIQYHLDNSTLKYRDTAQILRTSFYVDNCVTSVESEEKLKKFIKESTELMAEAKLDLRGWEHTVLTTQCYKAEPIPVLGLLWNKEEDVLYCDTSAVIMPEGPLTSYWPNVLKHPQVSYFDLCNGYILWRSNIQKIVLGILLKVN